MPAPRKYSPELRERATRLAVDARRDPETRNGAINRVAQQLDIHREALRTWARTAEAAELPEVPEDAAARLRALEKENRELRRANGILKSAAAFFAAEFDRPQR